jgi:hypothetical protein
MDNFFFEKIIITLPQLIQNSVKECNRDNKRLADPG